ncbi:hypothetical protein GCM10009077_33270 [Roseibium denhamense]
MALAALVREPGRQAERALLLVVQTVQPLLPQGQDQKYPGLHSARPAPLRLAPGSGLAVPQAYRFAADLPLLLVNPPAPTHRLGRPEANSRSHPVFRPAAAGLAPPMALTGLEARQGKPMRRQARLVGLDLQLAAFAGRVEPVRRPAQPPPVKAEPERWSAAASLASPRGRIRKALDPEG